MSKQFLTNVGLGVWGIFCLFALIDSGRSGKTMASALAVLACSVFMLLFIRDTLEREFSEPVLGAHQAWSVQYGCGICLPISAVSAAAGWAHLDALSGAWFNSALWLFACILMGLVAGGLFHYLDSKAYSQLGCGPALNSPSKTGHDWVAYPVISTGITYLGVPVVFSHLFWPYGAGALVGVIAWAMMGVRDVKAKPDPRKLHPM